MRGVVTAVKVVDEETSAPQMVRDRDGATVSAAEAGRAKEIADEATWPAWTLGAWSGA